MHYLSIVGIKFECDPEGWVMNYCGRPLVDDGMRVEVDLDNGNRNHGLVKDYTWVAGEKVQPIVKWRPVDWAIYIIPGPIPPSAVPLTATQINEQREQVKAASLREKDDSLSEAVRPLVERAESIIKQVRYQDQDGDDWIDECARTMTLEEFRGAMKFTIGKYLRRLGKKDATLKEVKKVADYAQRWVQYEQQLEDQKE